ncbi:MAG: hypothetical protein A2X28_09275 [Elusimicrobia bacterium GWA2_56_46]|nr:MAG: hypothetical protein A2X28_09275 [Elusimicrobia bacterium GWA2_56_46]OGR55592.1 MAG: hypothetical protein A2X39_08695 [Elusimicrobia bacterium GWC2_56_31]
MSKKILVVEDDVLVAELLINNIESLGCRTLIAYDGETGWELAKKEKPDLIIQDIGLPRMDGITLCKLIKSKDGTKQIPVIMLTGKRMVADMEDAFKAGADAYVNKPFDWDRMLSHIRKILGPDV